MKCSECGNELKEGVKFCTNCGCKVIPQKEIETNQKVSTNEVKEICCKVCGAKNRVGNTFCVACGANLLSGEQKVNSTSTNAKNDLNTTNRVPWIISCIIVILTIILLVASCFSTQKSSSSILFEDVKKEDYIIVNEDRFKGKVVINTSTGECMGRYEGEKSNCYIVSVQDDFEIPKKGHKVVTYSAAKGNGVILSGEVFLYVYARPSTRSPIVDRIETFPNDVFDCKGMKHGWVKIDQGYVRGDQVGWDCFNSY